MNPSNSPKNNQAPLLDPPILTPEEIISNLRAQNHPQKHSYKAMYSSWVKGIIVDPALMIVPVDDHLVHRGDGVFEALKFFNQKVYLMEPHLQRLKKSAEMISIPLNQSLEELALIIQQAIKASGLSTGMVRLFLSRGPGGFTTNPYESLGSQLYVIITELKPLPEEKYQKGVRVGLSQIAMKEAWMPTVKTCNYIPNVLMKKESVDRKLDFTVNQTSEGFIGESSTENIMMIDEQGFLRIPELHTVLKGCTMTRVLELAQSLVGTKLSETDSFELKGPVIKSFKVDELKKAREVFFAGTTLDVIPVVEFENHPIGDGKVGGWARKFREIILIDQGHSV